jgi:hypothetical protein
MLKKLLRRIPVPFRIRQLRYLEKLLSALHV